MAEHELEKLLGGFAADTLTPEEQQRLYGSALQDQHLFNALADEQALKELLTDPDVRRRWLQSLSSTTPTPVDGSASWRDWFRRPANLALAGGLATAVFAVGLGTKIYQDRVQPATRSTETAPPPTRLPAETLREDAPKSKREEDLKQATIPRAADSSPAAAKTARTAAGAPLPETGLSTVSARELFYSPETMTVGQPPERTMTPLAEVKTQTSPFRHTLDGRSQLNTAASPVTPGKWLGLRYSLVIQTPDGPEQEIDAAAASRMLTPVQLTIDVNQDSYLQVWRNAGSATTHLLLPQKESGHISMKIQAGQRQRLLLPADSGTVIVRLSRIPFGPISRQEAALLNRHSPHLLWESGSFSSPTGLQEQATYVVSQDPSPTAEIAVDILRAQQQ